MGFGRDDSEWIKSDGPRPGPIRIGPVVVASFWTQTGGPFGRVVGAREMAASSPSRAARLAFAAAARSRAFASEAASALAEIKPGEVGIVSGIPKEHLRRRVMAE